MFSKPATVVLLALLVAVFVLLRIFVNLGGAGGFAFNVATIIAIFLCASYVWQRSELHPTNRR